MILLFSYYYSRARDSIQVFLSECDGAYSFSGGGLDPLYSSRFLTLRSTISQLPENSSILLILQLRVIGSAFLSFISYIQFRSSFISFATLIWPFYAKSSEDRESSALDQVYKFSVTFLSSSTFYFYWFSSFFLFGYFLLLAMDVDFSVVVICVFQNVKLSLFFQCLAVS